MTYKVVNWLNWHQENKYFKILELYRKTEYGELNLNPLWTMDENGWREMDSRFIWIRRKDLSGTHLTIALRSNSTLISEKLKVYIFTCIWVLGSILLTLWRKVQKGQQTASGVKGGIYFHHQNYAKLCKSTQLEVTPNFYAICSVCKKSEINLLVQKLHIKCLRNWPLVSNNPDFWSSFAHIQTPKTVWK